MSNNIVIPRKPVVVMRLDIDENGDVALAAPGLPKQTIIKMLLQTVVEVMFDSFEEKRIGKL